MSTRDIIDAIASGDSVALQSSFEQEMASRIAERLETMRQEVAQNMFKEHVQDLEEATVHPNALHVQHVGGGKYKVHAVGKNFADGIKVGEHLSDSDLDDFQEMGGKIKHVKPVSEGAKADALARAKEEARAEQERETEAKRARLARQRGDSNAQYYKGRKTTSEEVSIEEATVGANHIHVQHVGGGKYKVHAVGKNFAHGIDVGEHLSDSELDDFQEMGGKIKHVKQAKEEVELEEEQLDELKKSTLASYAKKAADDVQYKSFMAGHLEGGETARKYGGSSSAAVDLDNKSRKRLAGVAKAVDRLAKEEVDISESEGRSYGAPGKYHVDVDYHRADGSKTTHRYTINKASSPKHARNIAMMKHNDKFGPVKPGEQYSTDAMNTHVAD